MKKNLILILILLSALKLWSLDINDPSHDIYEDLEIWQEKGYYRHIPESRPYAAQLILYLLQEVMDKGTLKESRAARNYYNEIDQGLRIDVNFEISSQINQERLGESRGIVDSYVRGIVQDNLSLWGNVSAELATHLDRPDYFLYSPTLPYGQRYMGKAKEDEGKVGGLSIMSGSAAMLSYGTPQLHINMGLSRSSFGPFQNDGVVVSNRAFPQGHYELTWWGGDFSYSSILFGLVGSDHRGEGFFTQKYMALHSYNWAPFDWLDLGYFETVLFGGRFEPLYLLPFSYLFYSQGLMGFADNSLMGLKIRTLLPNRVELNGVLYIDDINFNQMVKGNFNTKMKIALESGISWTPASEALYKISLDYTAVMPYMYTHYKWFTPYADEEFNHDNYTHMGAALGASMNPNSDRIVLNSQWRAGESTKINLFGTWMRHGNASEDYVGDGLFSNVIPDGTLFDNGVDDNGDLYFQDTLSFLNQSVLEYVLQCGADLTTTIDLPFIEGADSTDMHISLGYTFERIWNSGRNSQNGFAPESGKDEMNHFFHLNFKLFL